MKRLSLKFFNLAHVTIMAAGVLVSPESGASVVVLDDPPILRVKTVANPENGHTYHLISGEATPQNPLGGVTWSAADAYAKSLSSDTALSGLVSINNPAEQSWLTTHFPAIFSGQGYRHQVIWIGLNDRNHEGIFCWENGEKWSARIGRSIFPMTRMAAKTLSISRTPPCLTLLSRKGPGTIIMMSRRFLEKCLFRPLLKCSRFPSRHRRCWYASRRSLS